MQAINPIDTSIKGLLRGQVQVLFQLLGQHPVPGQWRWEDTALNLPELHADHALVIGTGTEPVPCWSSTWNAETTRPFRIVSRSRLPESRPNFALPRYAFGNTPTGFAMVSRGSLPVVGTVRR